MVCNNNYVIFKDMTHNIACEEIKPIVLLRQMRRYLTNMLWLM